jgi:hypothetical protein
MSAGENVTSGEKMDSRQVMARHIIAHEDAP